MAFKRDLSDPGALEDAFQTLRLLEETDFKAAHEKNKLVRRLSAVYAKQQNSLRMLEINKKALLFDAPVSFDAYMQYLEWNRKPNERFYLPRRKVLKPLVDAMQMLADDELDELFLSMPPRVGKTSMLMFYDTWIIGRDPEKSNLYSAYSDVITTAFYNGCLEILNDPNTYLWHDVFPGLQLVRTNAKDEVFDVGRKKRYPSLTCRSLYGTLNGACDCNGTMMADDLISGIEESLNKDRLLSAWLKVDNNLLPRAKEKARILWVGTRWSQADCAGVRMDLLVNDEKFKNRRFKIINVPALDENDHSNFSYLYGVGFSDEYYIQRRASFERNNDMASWFAQYQGEPIERTGALFSPEDMTFYNGELPAEEPVRKFMAIDPAFGGGDFTAGPICYEYEDGTVYVPEVMYNDGEKNVTQPEIARKIIAHNVQFARFEANKSTMSYKEAVEDILKSKNYKLNITTKAAPNNMAKEARIFERAPEIRQFHFLEDGKRSKEYSLFMQNLFSFSVTSKNKHDDASDSCAIAVDFMLGGIRAKAEIFQRPI